MDWKRRRPEMCWARDKFKTPERAAKSLNKATVRYIRDRAAGQSPGVPDVLWQGDDCWLFHNEECHEFNRLVRDIVIAQPTSQERRMAAKPRPVCELTDLGLRRERKRLLRCLAALGECQGASGDPGEYVYDRIDDVEREMRDRGMGWLLR